MRSHGTQADVALWIAECIPFLYLVCALVALALRPRGPPPVGSVHDKIRVGLRYTGLLSAACIALFYARTLISAPLIGGLIGACLAIGVGTTFLPCAPEANALAAAERDVRAAVARTPRARPRPAPRPTRRAAPSPGRAGRHGPR